MLFRWIPFGATSLRNQLRLLWSKSAFSGASLAPRRPAYSSGNHGAILFPNEGSRQSAGIGGLAGGLLSAIARSTDRDDGSGAGR